jgi:hypothetical protein
MRLADYTADDRYFELNPNSGGDFRLKLSPPRKDRLGYAGMGQMLRPKKDKSSLPNIFSRERWLAIGADKWKLFDDSLVGKHIETFGVFLCELSLHREGKCIRKFRFFEATGSRPLLIQLMTTSIFL